MYCNLCCKYNETGKELKKLATVRADVYVDTDKHKLAIKDNIFITEKGEREIDYDNAVSSYLDIWRW